MYRVGEKCQNRHRVILRLWIGKNPFETRCCRFDLDLEFQGHFVSSSYRIPQVAKMKNPQGTIGWNLILFLGNDIKDPLQILFVIRCEKWFLVEGRVFHIKFLTYFLWYNQLIFHCTIIITQTIKKIVSIHFWRKQLKFNL